MRLQTDFVKVIHEFANVADFLIIYLEEAHPNDGWRFNVSRAFSCFYFSLVCTDYFLSLLPVVVCLGSFSKIPFVSFRFKASLTK